MQLLALCISALITVLKGAMFWKLKKAELQPEQQESISIGEKNGLATIGLSIMHNQVMVKKILKLKREETRIHVEEAPAVRIEDDFGMIRIVD